MPRYFFHVSNGDTSQDDHGTELADPHAAWDEATTTFGEMLRDVDGSFQMGRRWVMKVEDESGRVLFTIKIEASSP